MYSNGIGGYTGIRSYFRIFRAGLSTERKSSDETLEAHAHV